MAMCFCFSTGTASANSSACRSRRMEWRAAAADLAASPDRRGVGSKPNVIFGQKLEADILESAANGIGGQRIERLALELEVIDGILPDAGSARQLADRPGQQGARGTALCGGDHVPCVPSVAFSPGPIPPHLPKIRHIGMSPRQGKNAPVRRPDKTHKTCPIKGEASANDNYRAPSISCSSSCISRASCGAVVSVRAALTEGASGAARLRPRITAVSSSTAPRNSARPSIGC